MKIIDYKGRMSRLDDSLQVTEFLTRALIAFLIFAIAALLFTLLVTPPMANGTDEFMVSPDYQSYMHKQGGGWIFNDMEVE
jgi:hypothetical protein